MRTLDEAMAASVDSPAFANGTEGSGWTAAWCEHCVHDAAWETDGGCPLIKVTLLGRRPVEFLEGPRTEDGTYSIAEQWMCTEFRPRDDDGGPDPTPEPVPECGGQIALMSTEAVEGPLVHLAVPDVVEVTR